MNPILVKLAIKKAPAQELLGTTVGNCVHSLTRGLPAAATTGCYKISAGVAKIPVRFISSEPLACEISATVTLTPSPYPQADEDGHQKSKRFLRSNSFREATHGPTIQASIHRF